MRIEEEDKMEEGPAEAALLGVLTVPAAASSGEDTEGGGAPPAPIESPESPGAEFRPESSSFTEMLRSKLAIKAATPPGKESTVEGAAVTGKKATYAIEALRSMARTLISSGKVAAWPEDIASQYLSLSAEAPQPHQPAGSVKNVRKSAPTPYKQDGPESVAQTPATLSRAAPSSASSAVPASSEIPPFSFRIQVSKSRGFCFFSKPAPSTETLYVFRHRMPWKNFTQAKCMGSWELSSVRSANKEARAKNPDVVDEWLLKSATPGGTGMVKWLDDDDNVLCSFTLRVPLRKFVLNSCADGTWGREEFASIQDRPGAVRPAPSPSPAAGASLGGRTPGAGASQSGGGGGGGGGGEWARGSAQQAPASARRDRNDLWDAAGPGDTLNLGGEKAAAQQRAIFEEERRQFEKERAASRKAGVTNEGTFHADSDALLDALIEEDAALNRGALEDDGDDSETFGGGGGSASASTQSGRKVAVSSLFGGGASSSAGAGAGAASLSSGDGLTATNLASAFGSSLFAASKPSGGGGGGADDMDALFGDLPMGSGLGKTDSWLSLDAGSGAGGDLFGLGDDAGGGLSAQGPFTSILGAALGTNGNGKGKGSGGSLAHLGLGDDGDIDLSIAVPSWSPSKAGQDFLPADPSGASAAAAAAAAAAAGNTPTPLSLSALFNAAKRFDGPSGASSGGAVSRDEHGHLIRDAPAPDARTFNVLSKLGFEDGGGGGGDSAAPEAAAVGSSPAAPASSFAFHQTDGKSPAGPIKPVGSATKKAAPAMSAAARMSMLQKQMSSKSPVAAGAAAGADGAGSTQGTPTGTAGMKKVALSSLFGAAKPKADAAAPAP